MAIADTSAASTATMASSSSATPPLDVAQVDQAPALADAGQRAQLGVAVALADPRSLPETSLAGDGITAEHGPQRRRVAQVALLDTVELAFVEQALGPVDPSAAPGEVTAVQQRERQPEAAASGPGDLTDLRATLVGPCPDVGALPECAGEIGRRREPLEIVDLERLVPLGRGQILVGPSPGLAVERCSSPIDLITHGQSLPDSGGPRWGASRQSQKDSLPAGAAQIIHRSAIWWPSNS